MIPEQCVNDIITAIPQGVAAVPLWLPHYKKVRQHEAFATVYGPQIIDAWLSVEDDDKQESLIEILIKDCPEWFEDIISCHRLFAHPGIFETLLEHWRVGLLSEVESWIFYPEIQDLLIEKKVLIPYVIDPLAHPQLAAHQQRLLETYDSDSIYNPFYNIQNVNLAYLYTHWLHTYKVDPAHRLLWAVIHNTIEEPNIIVQDYINTYASNDDIPLFLSLLELPSLYPNHTWDFEVTTPLGQFLHSAYMHYIFWGEDAEWEAMVDNYFEENIQTAVQEWLKKHPNILITSSSEIILYS